MKPARPCGPPAFGLVLRLVRRLLFAAICARLCEQSAVAHFFHFAYSDIGFAFSNKAILSNILYSCKVISLLPALPKLPISTRISYVVYRMSHSSLACGSRVSRFTLHDSRRISCLLSAASLMCKCLNVSMRVLICSSTHLLICSQALRLCVNYILYSKTGRP